MKKILLMILSSNQELYQATSDVLLKGYKMWLEKIPMDIDIVRCTAGEKTERIGNTLYMDCDDRDLYTKGRIIMEYIMDHPEYDIVINTNACTLVNLVFINRFVNSDSFNSSQHINQFFGHSILTVTGGTWAFLNGTFLMCTHDFFIKHICDFEKYDKYNSEIEKELQNYEWFRDRYNDKHIWSGVGNDATWGKMVYDEYIDFAVLPSITTRNRLNTTLCKDTFNINLSPIYDQHFDIPYDDRLIVEPTTMGLAFMCMINHMMTDEEYNYIVDDISYYNKQMNTNEINQ
jgi:hypothetical protein